MDSLTFSRQLRDSAIVYRDIVAAQHDDPDISRLLGHLSDLGASAMYPVVLSAFETITDNEDLKRFLHAVVVAFVRHAVIGRLENSLIENITFSMAKSLREQPDSHAAIEKLRNFAPSDDSFKAAFQQATIADRAPARYVLAELERSRRATEELEVAMPPKVHVEHIYPQTPQPGEKWNQHADMLNRIGNLTLLSRRLDSAIKNAPFAKKKPYYEKSELVITKNLTQYGDWSAKVRERQIALSENVIEIWSFPT